MPGQSQRLFELEDVADWYLVPLIDGLRGDLQNPRQGARAASFVLGFF